MLTERWSDGHLREFVGRAETFETLVSLDGLGRDMLKL